MRLTKKKNAQNLMILQLESRTYKPNRKGHVARLTDEHKISFELAIIRKRENGYNADVPQGKMVVVSK